MTTATIRIQRDDDAALDQAAAGFIQAWNTSQEQSHVFSFSSPEQLFTVITPQRWTLIERLQKLGPSTYSALALALSRDIQEIQEDATVLTNWGLLQVAEDGRVLVPYEVIHANFDLRSVA